MSATDAAVKLVEEDLTAKEKELEEKAGPLANEIATLKAFIKKNTKGSASTGPTVPEADLVAAVAHCSKQGPALAKDIAKFLGTDTRNIARRLSSFAGEGKIAGDKDEGYTAI